MCIHSFNVIVGYVGGRHYSHSGGAVEIQSGGSIKTEPMVQKLMYMGRSMKPVILLDT